MKVIKDLSYGKFVENKLDLWLPDTDNFDLIVFFHGGGLESGDKSDEICNEICRSFCENNIAVANVNYRMYPIAKYPDYLQDGAVAIKFVFDNIKKYGKFRKFIVSGQSAGAYISMMLCMNNSFFSNIDFNKEMIDAWIIDSAQQFVHYNILREKGLDKRLERIDETAPIFYVNNNIFLSRMLLICYENDIPCRLEENKLFFQSLKRFKSNADIEFLILPGDHCQPSYDKKNDMLQFVKKSLEFIYKK